MVLPRCSLLVLSTLWLLACSHAPKAAFGAACDADEACETGMCVGDGSGGPQGRCTRSCARGDDCPNGWSCGAITTRGVAVCTEGNGVPIVPSEPGDRPTRGQGP